MVYYILLYEYDGEDTAKIFTSESDLKRAYLNLISPALSSDKQLTKMYQIFPASDKLIVLEPYLDEQFQLRLREKESDN